jgi:hypothetical protein
LDVLAEIAGHALQSLPSLLVNMLCVLSSSLASVVAVSFFRGETTLFTTPSQLIIFVTGTLSPILGILGGIAIVLKAQRKGEFDQQRELAVLFTLVLFAMSSYYGLVRIPEFTLVS